MKRRSSRVAVFSAALTVCLALAGQAAAHGDTPGPHSDSPNCLVLSSGSSIRGGVIMHRTPGFQDVVTIPYTGMLATYKAQWLVYRLWAGYYDTAGQWRWVRGSGIAREQELGDGTGGLNTLIETLPGRWEWKSLAPYTDPGGGESVVTLPRRGAYYVYAEFTWGPIHTASGAVAYPGATHWEAKGWFRC